VTAGKFAQLQLAVDRLIESFRFRKLFPGCQLATSAVLVHRTQLFSS